MRGPKKLEAWLGRTELPVVQVGLTVQRLARHDMQNLSDWELVTEARSGDLAAFETLVQRYQEPVVRFCSRMTGSREDAEDIAQDSFVRLYQTLHRLKPKAKFSTYLFTIARNRTLNHLRDGRSRGRDKAVPLEETSLAVGGPSGAYSARRNEITAFVDRALERLSADHREVIVLRELEGMDYESIAAIIGCRPGTVKSRLARGREQLRQHLLEMGALDL